MTLPTSGVLSLSQINTELGYAVNAPISLNAPEVRGLANKASGVISISDLYGKSRAGLVTPNYAVAVLGTVNQTSPWVGSIAVSGWPDGGSQWVWNDPAAASATAVGTSNYQVLFNNTTGVFKTATIYFSSDNSGTVYVNNTSVGGVSGWQTPAVLTATLIPRWNRISVSATNDGTSPNPAGWVLAMYVDGAVQLRSDGNWTYY